MKDQPEDNFEQRLRERLQSLESDPPTGAWDRLVGDLPAASPVGTRRWAALLVLLGVIIGAAVWWTLTNQSAAQEEVASNAVTGSSPADLPPASVAKPSADSVKPYGLTKPTEPENQSARQPKREGVADLNQNITQPQRQTSAARISGDTGLPTEPNYPENSEETASYRPTSDSVVPPSASYPKETTRYNANSTDRRTSTPLIAPHRPTITAELPAVAILFRPSNLVSKPLPSPEPTLTPSRWELWATANPMLLYQRVAPDVSDEIQVTSLNRATFSQDRLGLQVSAGGLYRFNPRLALKLGAYYRYTRDQWTYNYHNNVTDSFSIVRIDENTVEAMPVYEEQRGTVNQIDHQVGALAGVQYRLSNRWLGNILGAELQAQSLTEKPAWYAHVSYVAERKLSRRWLVYGGPSFLWNFSGPGTRSDHFVLKPYGFGAQLGISYQLQFPR